MFEDLSAKVSYPFFLHLKTYFSIKSIWCHKQKNTKSSNHFRIKENFNVLLKKWEIVKQGENIWPCSILFQSSFTKYNCHTKYFGNQKASKLFQICNEVKRKQMYVFFSQANTCSFWWSFTLWTSNFPFVLFCRVTSLMLWSEESRWKPSDDLSNQEKNQYWTVHWWKGNTFYTKGC